MKARRRPGRLPTALLWTLLWVLPSALISAPALAERVAAVGEIEVLFSPRDDAEGALINAIAAAAQSIHVQAFIFTSRNIGRALIAAQRRGVAVRIIADRRQAEENRHSQLKRLGDAGIDIRLLDRYAAAHNKVMLIDVRGARPVVVTGSYNFSWSAQARNAENLLLLRGNRELAQLYFDNWRRQHDEAAPMGKAKAARKGRPGAAAQ